MTYPPGLIEQKISYSAFVNTCERSVRLLALTFLSTSIRISAILLSGCPMLKMATMASMSFVLFPSGALVVVLTTGNGVTLADLHRKYDDKRKI